MQTSRHHWRSIFLYKPNIIKDWETDASLHCWINLDEPGAPSVVMIFVNWTYNEVQKSDCVLSSLILCPSFFTMFHSWHLFNWITWYQEILLIFWCLAREKDHDESLKWHSILDIWRKINSDQTDLIHSQQAHDHAGWASTRTKMLHVASDPCLILFVILFTYWFLVFCSFTRSKTG